MNRRNSSDINNSGIRTNQEVEHNATTSDQSIKGHKSNVNTATAILTTGAILGIVAGLIWYNSTDEANRKRLFKKMKYYNENLSRRFR